MGLGLQANEPRTHRGCGVPDIVSVESTTDCTPLDSSFASASGYAFLLDPHYSASFRRQYFRTAYYCLGSTQLFLPHAGMSSVCFAL